MTGEKWGKPNHGVDHMSDLGKTISEWVASDETKDWTKRKIDSVPGLFLVKMPAKPKTNVPAMGALEINPADQYGNPTKRRGIYIRSVADMEAVAKVFGAKVPEQIAKLCEAMFDENAVVQDATDMLVIA